MLCFGYFIHYNVVNNATSLLLSSLSCDNAIVIVNLDNGLIAPLKPSYPPHQYKHNYQQSMDLFHSYI